MADLQGKELFRRGVKNSSVLLLSRVVSAFITAGTMVLVSRNFTLEQYGVYATVNAFWAITAYFTFGGLDGAVMRESSRSPENVADIYSATINEKIVLCIFAVIVTNIAVQFTNYSDHTKFLVSLVSLNVFFTGINNFCATYFVATERFIHRSIFNISLQLCFLVCAGVAFLKGSDEQMLLLSYCGLNGILAMVYFILVKKQTGFRMNFRALNFKNVYFKQGVSFFVISFSGFLFLKLDLAIVSFLGGEEDVAIYNIPYKLCRQAAEIRTAIMAGFFPVLVKRLRKPMKKLSFQRLLYPFVALVFIVAAVVSYVSPWLIEVVFGEKFVGSGPILQVLIFYVALEYAAQPYVILLTSGYQEAFVAKVYVGLAVFKISLVYVLFSWYGLMGVTYAMIITMFFLIFIMHFKGTRKLIESGRFI